jgi:hypothetical protein
MAKTTPIIILCLVLTAFLAAPQAARADLINVDIYSGHTLAGGGTPYANLVGSFTSSDVLFATNTSYNWHPFGLSNFGADITGFLFVAANDTYQFTLNSDDGSLLYIDGVLVVDNGGTHGPRSVTNSTFLTAGLHPFEVQFFEAYGGDSGVDLYLPSGINCTAIPIPSALLLLGSGLVGLAAWRRKL